MKSRKIVSLLLTGAMTAALLAVPAQAAEAPQPYTIQATHWSREDFSQEASPEVFTGVYSRELYNAIRQTMVDGTSGTAPAYTQVSKEDYSAVKKLIGRMEGVLRYEHHVPQNFTDYWRYLDYFAVSAEMPENYQAPLDFIQPALDHAGTLATDRERVEYFNDYIRSLLAYQQGKVSGITQTFAPHAGELKAACGSYARAMKFLRGGGHPLLHHQHQDPHLEPRVCGGPVAPCGRVRQRPLRQERRPAHRNLRRRGSGPGGHGLPQRTVCPRFNKIRIIRIPSTGRPHPRPAGFCFPYRS